MVGVTTEAERAAAEFAALDAMIREMHPAIGDTRACPDCGRPQHYTGTEYGWAHDALVDTWHCADPRKADTDRRLISHLTPGCTCDHRPGDPCNASCPVHLGAGLRRV